MDRFLQLTCSAVNAHSSCLQTHPSLLLPGPWPHPEQFVLAGIGKKSQKHQNLQNYPKMFEPL